MVAAVCQGLRPSAPPKRPVAAARSGPSAGTPVSRPARFIAESNAIAPGRANSLAQTPNAARNDAIGGASISPMQGGRSKAGDCASTGRSAPRQTPSRRQRRSRHQWRGQETAAAARRQSSSWAASVGASGCVCFSIELLPAALSTRRRAPVVMNCLHSPRMAGSDGAPELPRLEDLVMAPAGAPFGVFSRQLRSLCMGRRLLQGHRSPAIGQDGAKGRHVPPSRRSTCVPHRHAPISMTGRETIFCRAPPRDVRHHRHARAPVPPRRQRAPVYPWQDDGIMRRQQRAGKIRRRFFFGRRLSLRRTRGSTSAIAAS